MHTLFTVFMREMSYEIMQIDSHNYAVRSGAALFIRFIIVPSLLLCQPR